MHHSQQQEFLRIAFKSENGSVIRTETFGGTRHSVRLPLRDIAKAALLHDAHSVFVSHNHPSGDPNPSRADHIVTRQLFSALNLIGVTIEDHLITAGDKQFSFRKAGLL
jgi:DNA repair protein RadC